LTFFDSCSLDDDATAERFDITTENNSSTIENDENSAEIFLMQKNAAFKRKK
jgi:hypothetical protein